MAYSKTHGSVIQGFFLAGLHSSLVRPASVGHPGQQGTAVQRFGNGTCLRLPPGFPNLGSTPGQPLPKVVQEKMETILGARFDDVRVHVGPQATAIGALAFTQGSQIYFAPGQYQPATPHGQRLLAHELTHVVQQRAGRVGNPFGSGVAVVQDNLLEGEAERMALKVGTCALPVQAKMATAGASPVGPTTRGRSGRMPSPVLQLAPSLTDLSNVSATALDLAGGTEWQAITIGSAVVMTANEARGTQNFMRTAENWSIDTFTTNIPAEIRTLTGATRGRNIKQAATPALAAGKVSSGGLIVLQGGHDDLHAEQALLLVIAQLMSLGQKPGKVSVAGRNLPCGSCLKVLRAFSKWYKLMGYGTLEYNDAMGQDRTVTKLGRGHFPASHDRRFQTFIDHYENQKAGEYVGNNGAVSHAA